MFRAHDAERDHLVAVKLFKLDLPPGRVHQFVAALEHLVAVELTHPAIATPVAAGSVGASAYLATDYVAAESLDLAVREHGPAPPADALRVAARLAGALDYAAVVNITHGAIHPRDVLLSPDETRLTGLGVVRALEQAGALAPVRRPYSAPERLAGGAWDRRADIFSLAALVHELLWGRRIAGVGKQAAGALTEIRGGDLPALRAVFVRALAGNPSDRFATALEFAEALRNALPGAAVRGPAMSDPRSTTRDRKPTTDRGLRLPLSDPEPMPPLPGHAHDIDLPIAAVAQDFDLRAAVDASYAGVEPSFSPAEPSTRTRMSPMAITLILGAVVGFAAGYGYAMRGRPASPAALAPAGREFTEGTVPEVRLPPSPPSGFGEPRPPSPPSGFGEPRPPSPPSGFGEPRKPDATGTITPDTAKPSQNPGRLLVRSTPSGAAVFVNGRESGRTPVALRDLSHGTHRLRLVRDGYAVDERRVVISDRQPAQSIIVTLAPARSVDPRAASSPSPTPSAAAPGTSWRDTGALVVESRPPGANVFIDNKLMGTTPLTLGALPAGEHAVRLERDGYRRWARSVRIVATERNRVTASLER